MASPPPLLYLQSLTLLFSFLWLHAPSITTAADPAARKPYVVYMGSSSNIGGRLEGEAVQAAKSSNLQLLTSLSSRQETGDTSVIHHYYHAFRGFTAMLTEAEASALSGQEEVVSVFPDPVYKLHTTRSWDFLEVESSERVRSRLQDHPSGDIIIGIVDSGIWPEAPSFNDDGIGEIPARWKGTCMEGPDFNKTNCNRKLIGAKNYINGTIFVPALSPRDTDSHGTHTASTAGGAAVANVSYYGLANGTARGGLPSARIAMYKVCSGDECFGSAILKAIDDAIADGVDIISLSLGTNALVQSSYLEDPIALGAFHAAQKGVMVVCSAGNDGPTRFTVVNTAPWIVTVAASTIDRDFQSTVVLGDGTTFNGSAINFSNLTQSTPLMNAEDAVSTFGTVENARNCLPGALNASKMTGKIVVCADTNPNVSRRAKILMVQDRAEGMIFISDNYAGVPFDSGSYPFTQVDSVVGAEILKYINSTTSPSATILKTTTVQNNNPAPTVAFFSSRGPSLATQNILKPDIMAPGVAILAAVVPGNTTGPHGEMPSQYGLMSGTSMSCPHVTGAAAFIKSARGGWSPSMIRSALMTTATISNNMGGLVTNSTKVTANPHEMGAGEISPDSALHPGLVFETTMEDYLNFLCYSGYSEKNLSSMITSEFHCPPNASQDLISSINYPSISIGSLNRTEPPRVVGRTVTNVGPVDSAYTATVESPAGLVVVVSPSRISFSQAVTKVSYNVSFDGKAAPAGYNYGSITWSDGRRHVRTAFAVNVA